MAQWNSFVIQESHTDGAYLQLARLKHDAQGLHSCTTCMLVVPVEPEAAAVYCVSCVCCDHPLQMLAACWTFCPARLEQAPD